MQCLGQSAQAVAGLGRFLHKSERFVPIIYSGVESRPTFVR